MTASPWAGLTLCVGRWDLHYRLHNSPGGCDEFTAASVGTKLWGLLTYNRFRGVCLRVWVCERETEWEKEKEEEWDDSLNINFAVLPAHPSYIANTYTLVKGIILNPTYAYAHTGHSHTQRWGRQNEVKRRGNKTLGVQLLIASWVHHFKQAETAGEESGAEQRSSQLGWLMHSGEALHRPTLSLALGDCLPYQTWAWPMQLRRGWWGLDIWSGWVLEEERVWWEKLFLFFFPPLF